jgi:hypothetical protein
LIRFGQTSCRFLAVPFDVLPEVFFEVLTVSLFDLEEAFELIGKLFVL